jgi:hypothetical protein
VTRQEIDCDDNGTEKYGGVTKGIRARDIRRNRHPELIGVAEGILLRLVLEDEEAGGQPAILAAQRSNFLCDIRKDLCGIGVGHIASLERGNAIASILKIGFQFLPSETGFVKESEVRALRAMALEPESDVA